MQFDEEYFKSDEFQELLYSYETSVESGNPVFLDASDLVDIADYYNYKGEDEKAVSLVVHGLVLYPNDALLNVFMARRALMDDDYDTARQHADAIGDKDSPDYHYLVAEILVAENRIDEADQYLHELYLTLPPEELADFVKDVANLYVDYNVSDKAYEWMMRSQDDDSDDFKELMARALYGLGRYKDSQRLFNELIDHNPYSKQYWNALASAQFMDEDYGGSITSSEYALAIDPKDGEGMIAKANGLLKLNNYEQAIEYYQRYISVIGDDPFVRLHIGICLVNLGKNKEALDQLQEALKVSQLDESLTAQILQELAFCYAALQQTDDALAALDKTAGLDCDHNDIQVIRGHILLSGDRLEEAEATFKKAIRDSAGDPVIVLRVIVSLYDNHYLKASYFMFRKFFKYVADEDFNSGYAYMALCCFDLGRTDEFLHYLQEAVERNPNEARMVLGMLFPEDMQPEQYYDYMLNKYLQL